MNAAFRYTYGKQCHGVVTVTALSGFKTGLTG